LVASRLTGIPMFCVSKGAHRGAFAQRNARRTSLPTMSRPRAPDNGAAPASPSHVAAQQQQQQQQQQ